MATLTSNLRPGQSTANADYAGQLGELVFVGPRVYRFCKAGAAITTAASLVLTSALSSGAPTWVCTINATAADTYKQKVRVVVPEGQVGTGTTTTTLASGDYFLGQVSGPTKFKTAAALVAGGSLVLVVNSLGKVKASTLTTAIAARAAVGFGTHTANATAADVIVGGMLPGLV